MLITFMEQPSDLFSIPRLFLLTFSTLDEGKHGSPWLLNIAASLPIPPLRLRCSGQQCWWQVQVSKDWKLLVDLTDLTQPLGFNHRFKHETWKNHPFDRRSFWSWAIFWGNIFFTRDIPLMVQCVPPPTSRWYPREASLNTFESEGSLGSRLLSPPLGPSRPLENPSQIKQHSEPPDSHPIVFLGEMH